MDETGVLEREVGELIRAAFGADPAHSYPLNDLLDPLGAMLLEEPERIARHAARLAAGSAQAVLRIARELDSGG